MTTSAIQCRRADGAVGLLRARPDKNGWPRGQCRQQRAAPLSKRTDQICQVQKRTRTGGKPLSAAALAMQGERDSTGGSVDRIAASCPATKACLTKFSLSFGNVAGVAGASVPFWQQHLGFATAADLAQQAGFGWQQARTGSTRCWQQPQHFFATVGARVAPWQATVPTGTTLASSTRGASRQAIQRLRTRRRMRSSQKRKRPRAPIVEGFQAQVKLGPADQTEVSGLELTSYGSIGYIAGKNRHRQVLSATLAADACG
jgi:hypothetical protein